MAIESRASKEKGRGAERLQARLAEGRGGEGKPRGVGGEEMLCREGRVVGN